VTNSSSLPYSTPCEFWEACNKYFSWAEDNPIVSGEGASTPRPMTMEGFLYFLKLTPSDWERYLDDEEFSEVVRIVDMAIWDQQFVLLAANLITEESIADEIRQIKAMQEQARVGEWEN
jgi:hypothetical protein